MAGNTVTLTFAGDAAGVTAAARDATRATESVGSAATSAGDDMRAAAADTDRLADRYGDLGSATTGALDSLDALGGGLQAAADMQTYAADKAAELAQATQDAEQAQNDLNQAHQDARQATRDAAQAAIDVKQANLDAKVAAEDYAAAVKEHGRNSNEARQAAIDLEQAQEDLRQAQEDSSQATLDAAQANSDAKQAQLDLNEAQRASNPPDLQGWADKVGMVTPLISSLVGVVGLATAAQWAWNAAQLASPLTWIVLAIAAVIAIIVVIATKTTWFQDTWRKAWGGIRAAASAVGGWFSGTLWPRIRGVWDNIKGAAQRVWDWMKELPGRLRDRFANLAGWLLAPFRTAFNAVARAWNNTIGRLSWTIPGWVPGVGGNSISAPTLPTFHAGGVAPVGRETLAILQSGERVQSVASRDEQSYVPVRGDAVVDALIDAIARGMGHRGNDPVQLGIRMTR